MGCCETEINIHKDTCIILENLSPTVSVYRWLKTLPLLLDVCLCCPLLECFSKWVICANC